MDFTFFLIFQIQIPMVKTFILENLILRQGSLIQAEFRYPAYIYKMILADIAMAVAPVFSYYPQLALLQKEKSMGTFSIYVCAILLISNIIRIFFWLTVGFAFPLLVQSLLVIAIMLMILKECVELEDHFIKRTSFWNKFWRWDTYQQYIKFLMGLIAALTVTTLLLQLFTLGYFGQLLGFLSLGIEAALGVPQVVANWQGKSVRGVSRAMITMWFLGDFGKTIYFISKAQPFQFILCGIVQLTVDTILIAQIVAYGKEYDSLSNPPPPIES